MQQETKIKCVVGVPEQWLVGEVDVNGIRLQDRMNDTSTDFLSVDHVKYFLSGGNQLLARSASATLSKKSIQFVGVMKPRNEAPEQRLSRYNNRDIYLATVSVSGLIIKGSLHLPELSQANELYILSQSERAYFPLTNAVVACRSLANEIRFPLLMVNRRLVNSLHVGLQETDPEQVRQSLHELDSHAPAITLPSSSLPASPVVTS